MSPPIHPIRYCTGGCSAGPHHAHLYTIDPVDGPLHHEHLCPGNLGEAREILDEEGQPTLHGFIATVPSVPPLPPSSHDLSDPALHFAQAQGPVTGVPHYVTHESGPGGTHPFPRPIRCF